MSGRAPDAVITGQRRTAVRRLDGDDCAIQRATRCPCAADHQKQAHRTDQKLAHAHPLPLLAALRSIIADPGRAGERAECGRPAGVYPKRIGSRPVSRPSTTVEGTVTACGA